MHYSRSGMQNKEFQVFTNRPLVCESNSHTSQMDCQYVSLTILMFHKFAVLHIGCLTYWPAILQYKEFPVFNYKPPVCESNSHTGQMDCKYVSLTILMFHKLAVLHTGCLTYWPAIIQYKEFPVFIYRPPVYESNSHQPNVCKFDNTHVSKAGCLTHRQSHITGQMVGQYARFHCIYIL